MSNIIHCDNCKKNIAKRTIQDESLIWHYYCKMCTVPNNICRQYIELTFPGYWEEEERKNKYCNRGACMQQANHHVDGLDFCNSHHFEHVVGEQDRKKKDGVSIKKIRQQNYKKRARKFFTAYIKNDIGLVKGKLYWQSHTYHRHLDSCNPGYLGVAKIKIMDAMLSQTVKFRVMELYEEK